MKQKLIAIAGGLVLLSLAAAGAFASQEAVTSQESTPATLEATETSEPTATPEADDVDDADAEADDGIRGIPDDNPNKHPEDGDGVCEHGETVIKTTPSGTQVNVPCHAGKDHDRADRKAKHAEKQHDRDLDAADDDDEAENDDRDEPEGEGDDDDN